MVTDDGYDFVIRQPVRSSADSNEVVGREQVRAGALDGFLG